LPTSTNIRLGDHDENLFARAVRWLRGDKGPFAELDALRKRAAAWSMSRRSGNGSWSGGRSARWFPHRQFLIRYAGRTRALDVPPGLQIAVAAGVGLCVLGVVGAIGFVAWERRTETRMAREMEQLRGAARLQAEHAAAEREHFDRLSQELARSLAERDQAAAAAFVTGKTLAEQKIDMNRLLGERDAAIENAMSERTRVSMERDIAIAERDEALAERDAALAANRDMLAKLDQRTRRTIAEVENIIASTGLDPNRVVKVPKTKGSALPRGGPFIPWRGPAVQNTVVAVQRNDDTAWGIERLEDLRDVLAHLPLASPVQLVVASDGFGFRIDPFTGQAALHEGLDLRGPVNTPIYATAAGVASFVGWHYDYGNMVEIDHGFGLVTRYAHLGKILVKKGEPVALHQQLGLMGATGRVTAVHLHYEVRVDGRARNPVNFLKADRYVPQAVQPVATETPAASGPSEPLAGFDLRR
jgi:murein DD-endopeptidase MepM/ murein hydrolase activator NlpD